MDRGCVWDEKAFECKDAVVLSQLLLPVESVVTFK